MCEKCGEKRAMYSNEHSNTKYCKNCIPNDEDYFKTSNRCIDCKQYMAYYGLDDRKAKWCALCSEKYPKSFHRNICEDCKTTIAHYGTSKQRKKWCKDCSLKYKDAVRDYGGCKCCKITAASIGFEWGCPLFCSSCASKQNDSKLKLVICYPEVKCSKCPFSYTDYRQKEEREKNDFVCYFCSDNARKKTKEYKVLKFLKETFPNLRIVHNRGAGTECNDNHLFPDFRIDLDSFILITEVDEYQHRRYDKRCELVRMYNIAAELGLPCVFIRYNPDTYRRNNKIKKISQKFRLELLRQRVNYWKMRRGNIQTNWIVCEQLYYNCECKQMCNCVHTKTLKFEDFKKLLIK